MEPSPELVEFILCPICTDKWSVTVVPVAPLTVDDRDDTYALILAHDPAHAACSERMGLSTLEAV